MTPDVGAIEIAIGIVIERPAAVSMEASATPKLTLAGSEALVEGGVDPAAVAAATTAEEVVEVELTEPPDPAIWQGLPATSVVTEEQANLAAEDAARHEALGLEPHPPVPTLEELNRKFAPAATDEVDLVALAAATPAVPAPAVPEPEPLAGKTVVVTGVLFGFDRSDAERAIVRAGGRAASAVTVKTDFLVTGDKPGAVKVARAKQLGIRIVTEAEEIISGRLGGMITPAQDAKVPA